MAENALVQSLYKGSSIYDVHKKITFLTPSPSTCAHDMSVRLIQVEVTNLG